MKLSGVMIGSDKPGKLAEFYTKILGEPGYHEGDWYGYQAGFGLMIGSHSEVHGKNDMPQRIMLTLEVDDVKASYEEVISAGAESVAEPYKPGAADDESEVWLATVADPDGNYVQLAKAWE